MKYLIYIALLVILVGLGWALWSVFHTAPTVSPLPIVTSSPPPAISQQEQTQADYCNTHSCTKGGLPENQ